MIEFLKSTAIFSEDKQYRYVLTRVWKEPSNPILWIMLNPSTADEYQLDPTLTRCLNFSQDWNFSEMIICNLFSLRSTNPKNLYSHKNPIGPENLKYILEESKRANMIMVGWGNHSNLDINWRNNLLNSLNKSLYCLGRNKNGNPSYPLYKSSKLKPILYL